MLAAKLLAAGDEARDQIGDLVTVVSQGVKTDARAIVRAEAYDTGALHDSIVVRRNNPLSARVVATAKNENGISYASFVEFGTSRNPHPIFFMRRANNTWWPIFVNGVAEIAGGTIVNKRSFLTRSEPEWSNRSDRWAEE